MWLENIAISILTFDILVNLYISCLQVRDQYHLSTEFFSILDLLLEATATSFHKKKESFSLVKMCHL